MSSEKQLNPLYKSFYCFLRYILDAYVAQKIGKKTNSDALNDLKISSIRFSSPLERYTSDIACEAINI